MSIRIAVAAGALTLALASGPFTVATATAAPVNPSFPNPGAPDNGQQPKKDEHLDKAEKLGGGLITKMIDSAADTLKCTLNIPLPTVKCG
ncbi:hypothetical protein [Nocardia seriolae]|uniref:hypothetical protein n=1 Tax=Nocardia seriolae TaxID=37332 RepID=UPI0003F3F132|nr:hypothetical protein [Nocardia seriolae]QUN21030.1 hypothetical protein KEC46_18495 [Nocardia seriolae]RLP31536.1 hypothetical protein D6158_12765 [Nocardia seriolae]WKY53833.1 hypothetical protein Q5P07_06935 [Nocardia seriolae]BAW09440.1 conserved hypothetical protein [Nocardia seriolae]